MLLYFTKIDSTVTYTCMCQNEFTLEQVGVCAFDGVFQIEVLKIISLCTVDNDFLLNLYKPLCYKACKQFQLHVVHKQYTAHEDVQHQGFSLLDQKLSELDWFQNSKIIYILLVLFKPFCAYS